MARPHENAPRRFLSETLVSCENHQRNLKRNIPFTDFRSPPIILSKKSPPKLT